MASLSEVSHGYPQLLYAHDGTEPLSDVTASLQILSGISNTNHTTIIVQGL